MAYQVIVKKRFTNKVQKVLRTSKKNGLIKCIGISSKNRSPYSFVSQAAFYGRPVYQDQRSKGFVDHKTQ